MMRFLLSYMVGWKKFEPLPQGRYHPTPANSLNTCLCKKGFRRVSCVRDCDLWMLREVTGGEWEFKEP